MSAGGQQLMELRSLHANSPPCTHTYIPVKINTCIDVNMYIYIYIYIYIYVDAHKHMHSIPADDSGTSGYQMP